MSGPVWTRAQDAAIHHEGGALLVSAAAGSGKTAVLVQRAVWMLTREDAPVDADALLILTFTNAAAQELRSRIAAELEKRVAGAPDDARLRRQKLLLGRAFIGTIDAFCQQLVREHFALLDLSPDVQLAQAAALEQLAQTAMAATMEEMIEDADFAAFAALYGRARSDLEAEEAIASLYRHVRTLPHPMRQLQRFAQMYEQEGLLEETAWGQELLVAAGRTAAAAAKLAGDCVQMAQDAPALAPYLPVLQQDAEAIDSLRRALDAGRWDGAVALAAQVPFGRLPGARGAEEADRARLQSLRKAARGLIGELQQGLLACTEAEFRQDIRAAAPLVRALVKAAALYDQRFAAAKKAERVLDFADFEHLALALLQTEDGERTAVAKDLARRHAAVMVDEYQDTNELQDTLYRCLAHEDEGNLFYVGDVKQSIYRFRNANPDIFLHKRQSWAPYESGRRPATLSLGHNFRSAAAVLDGVNFLFERLMSPAVGEMTYGREERLIPGESGGEAGAFELCVLCGGAQDEAVFVAKRIAQMLKEGTPVQEGGQTRPCRPEDFCVLARVRKNIPLVMEALRAEGVLAVADLGDELLKTPEVLPLVAALAAIDNPGDDIHLAAALLGPLFRFTADEVTRMRAALPAGRLWAALLAAKDEKAGAFVRQLRAWRALACQVDPGRLCEELVGRTGYLSAVAAMEDGSVRKSNLLRFIHWVGQMGAGGRGGLAGVVRLCMGEAGPEAPASKSVPGHVSLLTIHKSKGLEFPFCFLVDTAHRFNNRDLARRVQMHERLGVGLALRRAEVLYPTLPALAIRSRIARGMLSEELRCLYVALTRAKQRVVVCYTHREPEKALEKWALAQQEGVPNAALLSRAACLGDFVLAGAMGHPGSAKLWTQCGVSPRFAPDAAGALDFLVQDVAAPEDAAAAAERTPYRITAAADDALVARLAAAFGQKPPRMALSEVPAKCSVSALSKTQEEAPRKRPSFMYAQGLNAAEKGTAQHAFMQFADFEAAQGDLEGEIARLEREGYILPVIAKAVDRRGVRAFLSSPLAGRIAAAGQVLREYDFITALPAAAIKPGLAQELANEPVLVQGIADLVLVSGQAVEIVDYKTDRGAPPDVLAARYRTQLAMYANALAKRLALPVTRCTLWSFALAQEIDVAIT